MILQGKHFLNPFFNRVKKLFSINIEFGTSITGAEENAIIFFPYQPNTVSCGISAFVAFKGSGSPEHFNLNPLQEMVLSLKTKSDVSGSDDLLNTLFKECQGFKQENIFSDLFFNKEKRRLLLSISKTIEQLIKDQTAAFKKEDSNLSSSDVEIISNRLEKLQDIFWCLKKEILDNITAISNLTIGLESSDNTRGLKIFKRINAVLNSIDRLEVRGRDSAGISIILTFAKPEFENFREGLIKAGLAEKLKQRTNHLVLPNNSLTIKDTFSENGTHFVTISFIYKIAAEIGSLGDNVSFIRSQIKNDLILQLLSNYHFVANSVSAHTRWASVGDITIANCHPQDNTPTDRKIGKTGILHICLNGDIDNYLELKTEYEARYDKIHEDINTDTKLIPLQIEHYLKLNNSIEEAFRMAVNDFEGSHAISMHSNLAPGKLFLAQKGSGQAIFVGIAKDHYIAASELYGIVEETQDYIKLNGENKGQIVILDPNSSGGVSGIQSLYYDNTPISIEEDQVLTSQITSRDIDRQNFPHYFLKEISESPGSVEKTLEDKIIFSPESNRFATTLDETVIPKSLEDSFKNNRIKKIYFIGQGTAGIAAQGCADLLNFYLGDIDITIRALKSSELSGFSIIEGENKSQSMIHTLVVAISQSGTTTDTNRTVDLVKGCGAKTLAIVNRRDSDLTFKTDGVLYTSSGRDIEMSVASTKAFYSQITAGAILGLHITRIAQTRSSVFISEQISEIISLPDKMRIILGMKDQIKDSAFRLAVSKDYWATVGSGSNKTSADEIRIKLSELCYKTISSDFIEDKKHIDLSSEPLIIICAAGTRQSVLGDIIKDTAIFHAHKATPVVITTIGEDRFDPYARDVFKIPETKEHFAPVLNTLVGHIWGYYAALAINEGSRFMYEGKIEIQDLLDGYTTMGHDVYEILLEKRFRETIAQFYNKFSKKRKQGGFPAAMGLDIVANITLLLKYLSGRLPVSDFEIDFEKKGTPSNMLNTFFDNIGQAINIMARPVDAIKHQAKTVTVGTSRINEKFEGLVFDELSANGIQISQIINKNVLVIKNLQAVISEIKGAFLYQISGLSLLGDVTRETKIKIVNKTGALKNDHSRVEIDHRLKGTKNIIVREGNVYIGKGKKDNKNILVIPGISSNPATPNIIEYILSLNISFKPSHDVPLLKKIKALGGKYNRLKDWILESDNFQWDDKYLNLVEVETLFGDTAEKVVEKIINKIQ
ncbi:SIS domain-containing protein [Desulfobacula sp.]|uniref:SIS domain-containing protein n=1 Tax=Desulfobacula sp. TaxID=2593537 RepID=UPI0025C70DD2|nr:SIS domain-containing protein [Desulfobacula sp.]MBC2703000.1 SIS domain-containing protein [Desulfobacula sp.]